MLPWQLQQLPPDHKVAKQGSFVSALILQRGHIVSSCLNLSVAQISMKQPLCLQEKHLSATTHIAVQQGVGHPRSLLSLSFSQL